VHAASSWPCDSLLVSLDVYMKSCSAISKQLEAKWNSYLFKLEEIAAKMKN